MDEGRERPSVGDEDDPTRDIRSISTRVVEPAAASSSAWAADTVVEPGDGALELESLSSDSGKRLRLGRYVVLRQIGKGGMGTVLEAFDRTLDRRVALKVLHRGLGQEHTKRLLREAQALAKLSHPNVVQVYEVGEAEGQAFIAMELVQGRSLRAWLASEPRPSWRECVQAYLQAGEGLAAAHARGLVHRDFKPGNAVIDETGRVKVLDFGLARRVEEGPTVASSVELSVEEETLGQQLTQAGVVMGTPGYMAPEQMRGLEVDARSDQFSYCVALYEALYGVRPFEGGSTAAVLASVASGRVRAVPRGSLVPGTLRAVVLRGLAAEPRERWPSMTALLSELRRVTASRRRGWLVVGVVSGLGALGLGLHQQAESGPRCEGARAQLVGVWDDARRQEVEQAMLGTGLPHAADAWTRVRARLDAYAEAWALAHTEVCEATSVRHEQSSEVMSLRMGCLRERRRALQEAVGVLARADATRVEHAVALVAGLPRLARCDDVEALRAELPPPEDPSVVAEVDALRERLHRVRALDEAGAYAEAEAEVAAVAEQAQALGHPPLVAEALVARGTAHMRAGRYAEAEQDIERGYLLAAQHGHRRVEAAAVIGLTYVVGKGQARHDAGLQWGKTAVALAQGLRDEPELHIAALTQVGIVRWDQGELAEAQGHYERALELAKEALGPADPEVAALLGNLGTVLRDQGKPKQAQAYLEHALALEEEALGPAHPKRARTLGNVAAVLVDQGRLADAQVHLQRALGIQEQVLGSEHPDLAATLNNIGAVLREQGDLAGALRAFRRALAIKQAALGPDHPDIGRALANIALVLANQREQSEAVTHYERALAIAERAHGPDHPDVAGMLAGLGNVLAALGRHDEAAARLERAVAIREQALGAEHPDLAAALINLGNVRLHQGDRGKAAAHYARARTMMERTLGPTHPHVAFASANLAEIALAEHDEAAAREHAERAVAILEASELPPAMVAQARFLLARALWSDRAQRTRARAQAEQARDAYATAGAAQAAELVKVQTWLAEHAAP